MEKGFGSDNHSGAHPEIIKALVDSNLNHCPSYGTDSYSLAARKEFQNQFSERTEVFFVYNGTAANTLALKAMTHTYESVFCSDVAHVNVDECGAPEAIAGCKLIPLKSENGKISVSQLKENLIRKGDQHFSQTRVITITQPTELGTTYSVDEIRSICSFAKENQIYVHVDGARLSNSAVSLNVNFKEMIVETGVDAVSFGGTKNGFVFGEAVLFLNPSLAKNFKFIRKQGLNLPSKSRFIASQFLRYFQDDLWKKIASHENEMAQYLFNQLKEVSQVEVTYPVQSNAVFVKFPKDWIKPLRKKSFFYIWDETTFEARLMCSFDTTKEDIEDFVGLVLKLSNESNKELNHDSIQERSPH